MAIERARKTCDMCGDVIAVKYGLFYKTQKTYVTIRADEVDIFSDYLTGTVKCKRLYCLGCWGEIVQQARKARRGK